MDNQTTTEREIENQLISAGITLKLGRVELLEYITKLIAKEKAALLENLMEMLEVQFQEWDEVMLPDIRMDIEVLIHSQDREGKE